MHEWRVILVTEGREGNAATAEVVGFELYGLALDQARRESHSGGFGRVQLVDRAGRIVWSDDQAARWCGFEDRAGLGDQAEGFYTWSEETGWAPFVLPRGGWGGSPREAGR